MVKPLRHLGTGYTYRDILAAPEDERWEIINGVAYSLNDPDNKPIRHRLVVERLYVELKGTRSEGYQVFVQPFEVELPVTETRVEPDITVINNQSELADRYFIGTPLLIMEVVTGRTAVIDQVHKLALYEDAGVPEYWIVNPVVRMVEVYSLNANGQYDPSRMYGPDQQVPVGVLEGLTINLQRVFAGEE